MIRPDMRYYRPETAEEVCDLLIRYEGDVAVLGGGSQLLPKMNRGEMPCANLVDLRGLGLRSVHAENDKVTVEALTTYDDVLHSDTLAEAAPLLQRVAWGITGGRQIRNTATLIGAVCFAMPGTDIPAALVGLGADYRIHGPSGFRTLPSQQFHTGPFTTALGAGEFVHSMIIERDDRRTGYSKVKHSAGSWPIVTATYCRDSRGQSVTLGCVQATPLRVDLGSSDPSADEIKDAVGDAITDPWSDVLAPASYRVRIAGVVACRAYQESQEIQT